MQDIFIPTSSPSDALVHPLHTVTYVTCDGETADKIFSDGYGLTATGWETASEPAKRYLGFDPEHDVRLCGYVKSGEGANIQIRVAALQQETPQVRPEYLGLYSGGATISFPMNNLRAHEQRMNAIGIESTIGVKEMDFTSPTGETYTSAEIVYKAPEFGFVMGVTRPDIFVPTGPIDPATGMGAASYSARCLTNSDETVAFFADVLGYEIRRDVIFEVGERSALLMPEGTKERFVQGFAPGASTGYVVLMDHYDATKKSPAPGYGPPNRGIVMWSFLTHDIDMVAERAAASAIKVLQPIGTHASPFMPQTKSMILEDPDGFPIEIVSS